MVHKNTVKKMSRILFIVLLCEIFSVQAKFPDDPRACNFGDSECLVKIVNYYLGEKGSVGDSDINLVKLDPFLVARMNIKQGEESPVNIDLNFKNNTIRGLSKLQITKVKGFDKNLAGKHELQITAKQISLVGPYTIKGKVLILPISGRGSSNMTLINTVGIIGFVGKPVEKNGETYLEASNLKVSIKPKRMYYYFSNLFNGDKALGDSMNAFLNENWEAIFMEVKKSMEAALAEIFSGIITNVFSKYPYAGFFKE